MAGATGKSWQVLGVLIRAAAANGDVVLGAVEDGLIHLCRWAPTDGSLAELALPDDLVDASDLISITSRLEGWLVSVRHDRRAVALWLEADGSWSRWESLPGTWGRSQLSETDTGLALRWSLGQADWMEIIGTVQGGATWSPDEGWQVDVLDRRSSWASLAWSGDQLVAIWDEGKLKISELSR